MTWLCGLLSPKLGAGDGERVPLALGQLHELVLWVLCGKKMGETWLQRGRKQSARKGEDEGLAVDGVEKAG